MHYLMIMILIIIPFLFFLLIGSNRLNIVKEKRLWLIVIYMGVYIITIFKSNFQVIGIITFIPVIFGLIFYFFISKINFLNRNINEKNVKILFKCIIFSAIILSLTMQVNGGRYIIFTDYLAFSILINNIIAVNMLILGLLKLGYSETVLGLKLKFVSRENMQINILGLLLGLIYIIFLKLPFEILITDFSLNMILFLVYMFFKFGFLEELLFRGLLLDIVKQNNSKSIVLIVIILSVIFATIHLPNQINYIEFICIFLFSVFAFILRIKCNNIIIPSIIHTVYNVLVYW